MKLQLCLATLLLATACSTTSTYADSPAATSAAAASGDVALGMACDLFHGYMEQVLNGTETTAKTTNDLRTVALFAAGTVLAPSIATLRTDVQMAIGGDASVANDVKSQVQTSELLCAAGHHWVDIPGGG